MASHTSEPSAAPATTSETHLQGGTTNDAVTTTTAAVVAAAAAAAASSRPLIPPLEPLPLPPTLPVPPPATAAAAHSSVPGRGGRLVGSTNWTTTEDRLLLVHVQACLPVGTEAWIHVRDRYNIDAPAHKLNHKTVEQLRGRYRKLYSAKANPKQEHAIMMAAQIQKVIEAKAAAGGTGISVTHNQEEKELKDNTIPPLPTIQIDVPLIAPTAVAAVAAAAAAAAAAPPFEDVPQSAVAAPPITPRASTAAPSQSHVATPPTRKRRVHDAEIDEVDVVERSPGRDLNMQTTLLAMIAQQGEESRRRDQQFQLMMQQQNTMMMMLMQRMMGMPPGTVPNFP